MTDIVWAVVSNELTGAIQGQIRGQSLKAVEQTMDEILTRVRRSLNEPKRGRIYVRGGHTHQASAPGEAPASDTGKFWASFEVGVAMTADGPVGIIHTDDPKSASLEYGTGHIAPRPALTPAGEAARQQIVANLMAQLRSVA